VPRFSIRKKKQQQKTQKLNVFFSVKNRRNYWLYGITGLTKDNSRNVSKELSSFLTANWCCFFMP
jgi:hypothetical protein